MVDRGGGAAELGSPERARARCAAPKGTRGILAGLQGVRSSGARAAFAVCADDRGVPCGAAGTSRGSPGSSWHWGNFVAVARRNRCAPLPDLGETVRFAVARAPLQIVKACLSSSTCSGGRQKQHILHLAGSRVFGFPYPQCNLEKIGLLRFRLESLVVVVPLHRVAHSWYAVRKLLLAVVDFSRLHTEPMALEGGGQTVS